jgi:pyruvate dehydrogenase E1 component beta subunit
MPISWFSPVLEDLYIPSADAIVAAVAKTTKPALAA